MILSGLSPSSPISFSSNPVISQPILECRQDGYIDTPGSRFFKFTLLSKFASHIQLIPITFQSDAEKTYKDYLELCNNINKIFNNNYTTPDLRQKKEQTIQMILKEISQFTTKCPLKKNYRPLHFLISQCLDYLNLKENQEKFVNEPIINHLKINVNGWPGIYLTISPFSEPLVAVSNLHPKIDINEPICQDLLSLIQILQELYKDLTSSHIEDPAVLIEKFKCLVQLKSLQGLTSINRPNIDSENWSEFVEFICTVFLEDFFSYFATQEQSQPLQSFKIKEIASNFAKIFYTTLRVKNYTKQLHSTERLIFNLSQKLLDPKLIENWEEEKKYSRLQNKKNVEFLALAFLAQNLTEYSNLPAHVQNNIVYFSQPERVSEIYRFFCKIGDKIIQPNTNPKFFEFEKCFISICFGNEDSFRSFKTKLIDQIKNPKRMVREKRTSDNNKEKRAEAYSQPFTAREFPRLLPQNTSRIAVEKPLSEDYSDVEKFFEQANLNSTNTPMQEDTSDLEDIIKQLEKEDTSDLEDIIKQLEKSDPTINFENLIKELDLRLPEKSDHKSDFDILTYHAYVQLSNEEQKLIFDYCQKLTKIMLNAIKAARQKGTLFYKNGLFLAKTVLSTLPKEPQLSEKIQKVCQEYALRLSGLLGGEEYLTRQDRFRKMLLEPIVAEQAEELLWDLKCKEIQFNGKNLKESLQQKEGFDLECTIPLFLSYARNGKILLLPFSASFLEGNLNGFIKENQGEAEKVLQSLEIPIVRVPVIDNHQGYQVSAEELSKLQNALLNNAKEAKPPFLLFERKRPSYMQQKAKVGAKRKRSSSLSRAEPALKKRRKETGSDVIRRINNIEPTHSITAEKKKASILTADPIPPPSFADIAFWTRFSLLSAEGISKKVVQSQLTHSHYELLDWNIKMLEQLQKENDNTPSPPPIWLLKPYQQAAIDKIANLHSLGLSPILCFDMGLGKTYTYAGEIARFIADGGTGNILVTVPPATEEQTYSDLIDAMTEAQYTAALSSLQHLDAFKEEDEKQERIREIINFILRLRGSISHSEELILAKRNKRRKEMVQGLISLIPENRKTSQLKSFEIIFDFPPTSEGESPLSLSEIPFSYHDREQFRRIMRFRPDQCIEKLSTKKEENSQKIILTTYQNLEEVKPQEHWGLIIFDEAQLIHTNGTVRQTAAENLICAAREKNKDLRVLHSTGTPFENNLLELFTLINIANPGFIPQMLIDEFSTFYKNAKQSIRNPTSVECREAICQAFIQFHVMTSILNKLFIHKSKTDQSVLDDWKNAIPTKNVHRISVQPQDPIISPKAWERLKQIRENFYACPENLNKVLSAEYMALNHKDLISFKVKNNPAYDELLKCIEKNPVQELPHAPLISALFNSTPFKLSIEAKEKSLLFVHNKATAQLLHTFLTKLYPGVDVDIFTGDTDFNRREEIIKSYQQQDNPRPRFLIISLKTGGVGLNFPTVKNAFFLTGSYNPAVQAQAEDRIVRVGSTGERSIFHFYLGTVGEKHLKTIHKKKKRQSHFFFSKHLPKKENDFYLPSLMKELRQFIKMIVRTKAHQEFKQVDFPAKELIEELFESASSYLEDNTEIFEERLRKVHPLNAIHKITYSERMEIDLPTTTTTTQTTTTTTQGENRKRKHIEAEEKPISDKNQTQKKQNGHPISTRPISKEVLSVKDFLMIPYEKAELESALKLGLYFRKNKEDSTVKKFFRDLDVAQQKNKNLRGNIRGGYYADSPSTVRDFYTKLKTLMPSLPMPFSSRIFYNQNNNMYEAKDFFQGNREDDPLQIRKATKEGGGYNYDLLIPKSWFL